MNAVSKFIILGVAILSIPLKSGAEEPLRSTLSPSSLKDQSILPILQESQVRMIRGKEHLMRSIEQSDEDHMIVFFASWCGYCKQEIGRFLRKVAGGSCSRISFVSVDESESDLQAILKSDFGNLSPVYWDEKSSLRNSLHIGKLPSVLYINSKKSIRGLQSGSTLTRRQIDFMRADGEGRHGICQ